MNQGRMTFSQKMDFASQDIFKICVNRYKGNGSDGGEIGTVKEVHQGVDGTGYVLVPMGMIFKNDTYIPIEAVIKRAGTDVFINVPKMVAGKMLWNQPPTNAGVQEKQGQPAAQVDKLYQSFAPTHLV